ncbi:MAG TPA: hypothetical protein VGG09_00395, partial [Acidimicrobiales bacterium]
STAGLGAWLSERKSWGPTGETTSLYEYSPDQIRDEYTADEYASPPVNSTVFTPAAKQSPTVGHEAEVSMLIPGGGTSCAQDVPPVVVLMIVDPAPLLPV